MIDFTKYQGTGNDYLFIDGRDKDLDWPTLAMSMADRHFGVGSDGIIIAAPSDKAPVRMRIFNADGSEGEMCGNGIRCFSKFVIEHGLIERPSGALDVETNAGVLSIVPTWVGDNVVGARVDMGPPILRATDVPVDPSKAGASDYAALSAGLVEGFVTGLNAVLVLFVAHA